MIQSFNEDKLGLNTVIKLVTYTIVLLSTVSCRIIINEQKFEISIESLPILSKRDEETWRHIGALRNAEHFKLFRKKKKSSLFFSKHST